jgi:hypothetical protein
METKYTNLYMTSPLLTTSETNFIEKKDMIGNFPFNQTPDVYNKYTKF